MESRRGTTQRMLGRRTSTRYEGEFSKTRAGRLALRLEEHRNGGRNTIEVLGGGKVGTERDRLSYGRGVVGGEVGCTEGRDGIGTWGMKRRR